MIETRVPLGLTGKGRIIMGSIYRLFQLNRKAKWSSLIITVSGVVMCLFFQNCAKHEINPVRDGVLVAEQLKSIEPQALSILNQYCSACHNAAVTNTSLTSLDKEVLLEAEAYVPGKPESSWFYLDIIDGFPHILAGDVPAIAESERQVLRNWIQLLGGFGADEDVFAP